jgi:hypothetical protein
VRITGLLNVTLKTEVPSRRKKEPSLLKAVNTKHKSKMCSPVTGKGDNRQIAGKNAPIKKKQKS